MFKDHALESLGTRQKKWLDYLWYHNRLRPFRVTSETGTKNFNRWETIEECVCPIDHRELIYGEQLIEFDSDSREQNKRVIQTLKDFLKTRKCECYITDHNGRSPHLHVFYMQEKLKQDVKEVLNKHFKLDKIKFEGAGLCRCEGGGYYKNGGKTYSSFFNNIDEIKPVLDKTEVRFPCNVRLN
jgi:hypothetical protein